MSASHKLTVTPVTPWPEEQRAMVEARTLAVLDATEVREAYESSDYADLSVDDEDGLWLSFEDRWTQDGLRHAGRRLSRSYPDAEVRVEITWDTRDADEQGEQAWEFRGGVLIAEGATELVMRPVIPEAPMPISLSLEQDDAFHDLPAPERARRRGVAILEAARGPFQAEGIPSFVIGDLLSDLIHLSTHLGIDFDATLERAHERVLDEIQNPEI